MIAQGGSTGWERHEGPELLRPSALLVLRRLAVVFIAAITVGIGAVGQAHADSGSSEFLAAMHGQEPGTTRMTVVTVPGGDAELLWLANVACDAYEERGGLAAIAAVKAAEPNITFSRKDPMLILDAPTLLENKALTYICPWV
jgi:hypothetical protein